MNTNLPAWALDVPDIPESEIAETVSVDVVVVGGGHAGVQCALAAAEGGASVAVIERKAVDRMSWFGEQIGTFNSRFFIDRGFGPYDEGEIMNEFFRVGCGRVNMELIAKYVRNSGEMLDHMISLVSPEDDILDDDKMNFHQAWGKPEYPICHGGFKSWCGTIQFRGKLLERGDRSIPMGKMSRLSDFERYAMNRAIELGCIWRGLESAVNLVQDPDGRVTGVIAKSTLTGKYTRYLASKGVALCAGDFSGDENMCKALCDEILDLADHRGGGMMRGMGQDGTAHKLGVRAGGRIDPSPRANMLVGDINGPFGSTAFLHLNRDGVRYMNEGEVTSGSAQYYRQPLGNLALVTDSKWLEQLKVCGLNHGAPDFGRPEYIDQCCEDMTHVLAAGREGYAVRDVNTSERETRMVYGANTLPELADYLGYEGEAKERFLAEVEEYNKLCYAGCDTRFGKAPEQLLPIDQPPFYGCVADNKRVMVGLVTLAGLVSDGDMRILDSEDKPIPGLYAAGNSLGGRYALGYAGCVGGNSIGMAMTHGRVLGKALAE